MKISQLRSFVEIAKHNNITAVAEDRGVSLQAVSRQIRELEAELGVKLFKRHNSGVAITPQGQILLPRAERALQAFADCQLTDKEKQVKPTVIAVCVPDFSNSGKLCRSLEHRINRTFGTCVDINVMSAEESLAGLDDGTVAAIVTVGCPTGWEGSTTAAVATLPVGVAVCKKHPLTKGGLLSLTDLADHHLALRKEFRFFYDAVAPQLADKGIAFDSVGYSGEDLQENLGSGDIVTLLPYSRMWPDVLEGSVMVPLADKDRLSVEICVTHKGTPESLATAGLLVSIGNLG